MTDGLSCYRVYDERDGLAVAAAGRPPVRVRLRPYGLEAAAGDASRAEPETFGFYSFGKLLEFVARGLLRDWRPIDGWYGDRARAQARTACALDRRLRESWLTLVSRADPTVTAVQKAIFAATFGDAALGREPALYRDPRLVADVLRFPACAVAVRNAGLLTGSLDVPTQLAALADWKALFADTGVSYRSLTRTLLNLPDRVPHQHVCSLRKVRLMRPLRTRLQLLLVTAYAEVRADRADHTPLMQRATAGQVREAVHRLGLYLGRPLDAGRAADIRQLVAFVADGPPGRADDLLGLTDRAIARHRDRRPRPPNPADAGAGRHCDLCGAGHAPTDPCDFSGWRGR